MILYHGTSIRNLESILKNGLTPRGRRKSLWKDHPSAPDRVYLTNAYAVYFANVAAQKGEKGVILKVEVDVDNLVADEDALAQTKIADADALNAMSIKAKTAYWRKNAPKYPQLAQYSLDALGNAAHMGVIPPDQILKTVVYDVTPELVFGHDPTISVMNYRLLGPAYCKALAEFVETDGKEGRNVSYDFSHLLKETG
jgi:hypothetical protein